MLFRSQAITARLIKVDANGKTTWDEIGDVKATADKTKTVDLKWTKQQMSRIWKLDFHL